MKTLVLSFLVLLTTISFALADEPEGSIATFNPSMGTIQGSFGPDAEVENRDIFTIIQRGKAIGEAMVIKVDKGGVTLLPKNVKGTPRRGDTLKFARHAEVPLDGTEGWKTFTTPEFSVDLPTRPVGPQTHSGTNPQGLPVTATVWLSGDESDQTAYAVEIDHVQLRSSGDTRWEDAQSSMDFAVNSFASHEGGKVNWSRGCTVNGLAGREFELTTQKGYTIRGRIVGLHTTFYLAYAVAQGKGVSSRANHFLGSFKVTPRE
jgi:hypothetical protein